MTKLNDSVKHCQINMLAEAAKKAKAKAKAKPKKKPKKAEPKKPKPLPKPKVKSTNQEGGFYGHTEALSATHKQDRFDAAHRRVTAAVRELDKKNKLKTTPRKIGHFLDSEGGEHLAMHLDDHYRDRNKTKSLIHSLWKRFDKEYDQKLFKEEVDMNIEEDLELNEAVDFLNQAMADDFTDAECYEFAEGELSEGLAAKLKSWIGSDIKKQKKADVIYGKVMKASKDSRTHRGHATLARANADSDLMDAGDMHDMMKHSTGKKHQYIYARDRDAAIDSYKANSTKALQHGAMAHKKATFAGKWSNIALGDRPAPRLGKPAKKIKFAEQAEPLFEVSKKTLASYIRKAAVDATSHASESGEAAAKGQHWNHMNAGAKADKRVAGIKTAASKLRDKKCNEDIDVAALLHTVKELIKDE